MVGCVVSSGSVIQAVYMEIPGQHKVVDSGWIYGKGISGGAGMTILGVIITVCGIVCWFKHKHRKSREKRTQHDEAENRVILPSLTPIKKENGSVMIPCYTPPTSCPFITIEEKTQQDEEPRVTPPNTEKQTNNKNGTVMTSCSNDAVKEGGARNGQSSTVRKRNQPKCSPNSEINLKSKKVLFPSLD
ncbi:hypothetical protein UPYG_G00021220 [Umbra pygmaea]|uniref:Uncharacterized protein n=1 Tax=Umbra pygmaea TaxID=75934 RepID=A0ABD0XKU0_UMBPY